MISAILSTAIILLINLYLTKWLYPIWWTSERIRQVASSREHAEISSPFSISNEVDWFIKFLTFPLALSLSGVCNAASHRRYVANTQPTIIIRSIQYLRTASKKRRELTKVWLERRHNRNVQATREELKKCPLTTIRTTHRMKKHKMQKETGLTYHTIFDESVLYFISINKISSVFMLFH